MVRRIGDHIGASGRIDYELPNRLMEQVRLEHGDQMFNRLRERWLAIDEPYRDHEEILSVLRELGVELNDTMTDLEAVTSNAIAVWLASNDPMLMVRAVPQLLLENLRSLRYRNMLYPSAFFEPTQRETGMFIERHRLAEDLLVMVDLDGIFAGEHPQMEDMWSRYVDRLPHRMRNQLLPELVAEEQDEITSLSEDPRVSDVLIEGIMYLEIGHAALLADEVRALPAKLDQQFEIIFGQRRVMFDSDWIPLNDIAAEFIGRHLVIIGIIDQIEELFADDVPLLCSAWKTYFEYIPYGLIKSVEGRIVKTMEGRITETQEPTVRGAFPGC